MIAPADHPHRNAATATLAWLAEAEGSAYECYFQGAAAGAHFGGGDPGHTPAAELRGGTFSGGRHLEQLYLLLDRYECEVACLGATVFDPALAEAQVRIRARAGDIASFYMRLFETSPVPPADTLLVIGDGGRPEGVDLSPYAWPEVVGRKALAIAAGDLVAMDALAPGRRVEHLWDPQAPAGAVALAAPDEPKAGVQTLWMAGRWKGDPPRQYMLADPELAARWIPAAAREGWLPVFGASQARLIHELGEELGTQWVVYGRQQDDRDFLELSRLGVAFQLIDPGRPPFPILKACGRLDVGQPGPEEMHEPDAQQLEAWAAEGRVLSTLLFWTGMVRELESLPVLADLLGLTGMRAGVVLTSESFAYMPRPPLTLPYVPRELGGLAPRVEVLLASGGLGAYLESEAPVDRFAEVLAESVSRLSELLGGNDRLPRGWWGVMDAPLIQRQSAERVSVVPDPPYIRLRHGHVRDMSSAPFRAGPAIRPAGDSARRRLRRAIGRSVLRQFFESRRPFDGYAPGAPGLKVLEAVRDAGFEYAFTKAAFGGRPSVVSGVPGLTALNYTVGRWDGWTPFVTVNSLADLQSAERRLHRGGGPGWLAGTLDTCLWAFTGPVWERGSKLKAICDWMVRGGSSGRLVNVTPRTVARYAKLLASSGRVRTIAAR